VILAGDVGGTKTALALFEVRRRALAVVREGFCRARALPPSPTRSDNFSPTAHRLRSMPPASASRAR